MTKQRIFLKHGLFFLLLTLMLSLTVAFGFAANEKAVGAVSPTVAERNPDNIVLNWTKNDSITGVVLSRYDSAKKTFVEITKTTRSKYRITGLQPGEYYVFGVTPYLTKNGKTTMGNREKVRTYTTLAAVEGIKQSKTTLTSHRLSWKAVAGAEQYEIYYYKDSTKKFAKLGTTSKTDCNVSNLKPTTTYRYKICAIRTASNGKTVHGTVAGVFLAYTMPDTVKAVTAQDVTSNGCLLEWTPVERASAYRIFCIDAATGASLDVVTVRSASCILRNLPAGKKISCKVQACAKLAGALRYGEQSAAVTLVTKPAGTTITSAVRQNKNKIKLTWAPQDSCDGYMIYVSDAADGVFSLAAEVPVTAACEAVVAAPGKGDTFVIIRTYAVIDGVRMFSPVSDITTVRAAA